MDSSGLAHSLQTRTVCRCAECISNSSRIAGTNGWMKFKDSEWGRRERSPELLWSIRTQFCVCATPEFRAGPVLVFLWKDHNWVAAISSRTGVCPKAQSDDHSHSPRSIFRIIHHHICSCLMEQPGSQLHIRMFSVQLKVFQKTLRGNFWTMLPKP